MATKKKPHGQTRALKHFMPAPKAIEPMNTHVKLGPLFTNDNPRKVWSLVDERPEWLRDAVYAAHGNGADMPDDWTYSVCRDVCCALDEGDLSPGLAEDDDRGVLHEWVDGQVDIYTKALYQWQADMCTTSAYANAEERLADMGSEGLTGVERVSALQYCAIEAIAQTILSAVNDAADECEDTE